MATSKKYEASPAADTKEGLSRQHGRQGWRMKAGGAGAAILTLAGCGNTLAAKTIAVEHTSGQPSATTSPNQGRSSSSPNTRPTTAATGKSKAGLPDFSRAPIDANLCSPAITAAVVQAEADRYYNAKPGAVSATNCESTPGQGNKVDVATWTIAHSENTAAGAESGSVSFQIEVVKNSGGTIDGIEVNPNKIDNMPVEGSSEGVGDLILYVNPIGRDALGDTNSARYYITTGGGSGDFTSPADLGTSWGQKALSATGVIISLTALAAFPPAA